MTVDELITALTMCDPDLVVYTSDRGVYREVYKVSLEHDLPNTQGEHWIELLHR